MNVRVILKVAIAEILMNSGFDARSSLFLTNVLMNAVQFFSPSAILLLLSRWDNLILHLKFQMYIWWDNIIDSWRASAAYCDGFTSGLFWGMLLGIFLFCRLRKSQV